MSNIVEVERLVEKSKIDLLKQIYKEVIENYKKTAENGGELADIPLCINDICSDDLNFTYNGIKLLYSRYATRNSAGKVLETPSMIMKRVAKGLGKEEIYDLLINRRFVFNSPTLFNMYSNGAKGALSACYVTPVYDDMKSIMDSAVVQAMTFKYGGGQGFSFSNLRPAGAFVKGTTAFSSGPISFMEIYDKITDSVKQGGKRRGANMGILHDWHASLYNPKFDAMKGFNYLLPQPIKMLASSTADYLSKNSIEAPSELKAVASNDAMPPTDGGFIQIKKAPLGDAYMTNFNISVGVHDAFMEAVLNNKMWWMVNPQLSETTTSDGDYKIHYSVSRATGLGNLSGKKIATPFFSILEDEIEKAVEKAKPILKAKGISHMERNPYAWQTPAREIWKEIIENAYSSGDPGLILLDNHNKWNPTPWLGAVVATNPCGEQPLYPFESCNLGSISVEKYINNGKFDVKLFMDDVQTIVDAMDTIIDKNRHPDERQNIANAFTRKIGLGIMGLADALAKLNYPYDSDEAVAFTYIISAFLEIASWKRSWELGAKLGPAPAFECEIWDWRQMKCMKKASAEKLITMHTPALVKASKIIYNEDGWLKVKLHDIEIPSDFMNKIIGETRNRVEKNGAVKLIKLETLEKVLQDVFNINKDTYLIAKNSDMPTPAGWLALAIYEPAIAWQKLINYGRSLGAIAPRNTVLTTTAPTGSISIIAGTSSGIEPYFALVYKRKSTVGEFTEVIDEFRKRFIKLCAEFGISEEIANGIYDIIAKNKGSLRWALQQIFAEFTLPDEFKAELKKLAELFPMSMDFDIWYHLAHNIADQIYVDQSISKTINLEKSAPKEAVETAYLVAWLGGLKGVTIYRDESKSVQVIQFGKEIKNRNRIQLPKRGNQLTIAVKNGDNVVHVNLDENSTCPTCSL